LKKLSPVFTFQTSYSYWSICFFNRLLHHSLIAVVTSCNYVQSAALFLCAFMVMTNDCCIKMVKGKLSILQTWSFSFYYAYRKLRPQYHTNKKLEKETHIYKLYLVSILNYNSTQKKSSDPKQKILSLQRPKSRTNSSNYMASAWSPTGMAST
jgi:hypothetical protein